MLIITYKIILKFFQIDIIKKKVSRLIKKFILFLLIFSFILFISGCTEKNADEKSITVYAMDTVMDIKVYGGNDEILDKAESEIKRIEKLFKRDDNNSDVNKVNNSESIKVSNETSYLFLEALKISEETEGKFDISIAPVMDLWGFYVKKFYVPSSEEIKEELKKVDYSKISVNNDVVSKPVNLEIDLGGIAKGYTSDMLINMFKKDGIKSAIVSLGGNVQALGTKTNGDEWKVAVQNPFDENNYIGIIKISDKAVITSGNYQRYFVSEGKTYHHIIDTSTGYPVENGLVSVSIISKNGTWADGLSTGIFAMGLEKGIELWKKHNDFDVIFVTNDKKVYITDGIADKFESDMPFDIIRR